MSVNYAMLRTNHGREIALCSQAVKFGCIRQTCLWYIFWYGSSWQPLFYKLKPRVKFINGLLDVDTVDPTRNSIVVIDDLMTSQDSRIEDLFTNDAHHRGKSVIYLVQNLFNRDKNHRTISLNSQYILCFRSPRDASQLRILERQIFPTRKGYLVRSYEDCTSVPYSPLLNDFEPDTGNHLRLRGRILNQGSQDIYLPLDYEWTDSDTV